MFCGKCGQQIPDNSNLCCFCGFAVSQEQKDIMKQKETSARNAEYSSNEQIPVAQASLSQLPETEIPESQIPVQRESVDEVPEELPVEEAPAPKKKKNKKKILPWLYGALVLAVVAAVGLVLWSFKGEEPKSKKKKAETVPVWVVTSAEIDGTEVNAFEYDATGKLTYIMEMLGGEKKETYLEYKDGLCVKKTYHTNGVMDSYRTYTYDQFGRVITTELGSLMENTNNVLSNNTYEFDAQGNLLKEVSRQGNLETTYLYTYENGQLKQLDCTTNGMETYRNEYVYDAKGQLEVESCYRDGQLASKSTYKYDDKGNEIEKIYFENEVEHTRITHTYDQQGNLLEMIRYSGGEIVLYEKSKYDEGGKLMQKEVWSGSQIKNFIYTWKKMELPQKDAEILYQNFASSVEFLFPDEFIKKMEAM